MVPQSSTCRQQTEYLAQHPHVAQQWHDHELQLEQQALAQQAFLRSMHPPRGMIHDYILNGAFSLSVFVCHLCLFLLYIRSLLNNNNLNSRMMISHVTTFPPPAAAAQQG